VPRHGTVCPLKQLSLLTRMMSSRIVSCCSKLDGSVLSSLLTFRVIYEFLFYVYSIELLIIFSGKYLVGT
jgi:hypothetical protein